MTTVPLSVYLDSDKFKEKLSEYYKELTGEGVLIPGSAALVRADVFRVRRSFFENFTSKVSEAIKNFSLPQLQHDLQTLGGEKQLWILFDVYTSVHFDFYSEQSDLEDREMFAWAERASREYLAKVDRFKGEV